MGECTVRQKMGKRLIVRCYRELFVISMGFCVMPWPGWDGEDDSEEGIYN